MCATTARLRNALSIKRLYLEVDEIIATVRGCACRVPRGLLTLGEKPELRYRAAREWLQAAGFDSTVDYVAAVARVLDETGCYPINAGTLVGVNCKHCGRSPRRWGSCSRAAPCVTERGGPHFGSPDKKPFRRWLTLARAGALRVPMTTGLLVGIGETREERVKDLQGIARLHRRYGHIQEVIIQNFCAKPGL